MAVLEKMRATRTFIEESWVELQKVTWPDYDQLKSATIVVIVFVMVISAVIFGMDRIVDWIIRLIITSFGG